MKNKQDCKICTNTECFLFKHSSVRWNEEFSKNKLFTHYKKNQLIFKEGDVTMGIYFIQKGKVKVYKETNYRGQIVRLAKDGDILGHRGFGGNNKYTISASTLEDSWICFISQDMLFRLMESNVLFSINMMLFYANELKKTEVKLRNMAVMTVRERIADALLSIMEKFGLKNGENYYLAVDLSRKEIAEIAGTYPEQVSRYISEFKKEKILNLEGKRIILLQPEKLIEMIKNYEIFGEGKIFFNSLNF